MKIKKIDIWKELGLFSLIIILFSLGLNIGYITLMNIFFWSLIFFMTLSLSYFFWKSDDIDRKKLLSIWKVYFSVITLMIILLFSLLSYINKLNIDHAKTLLIYSKKENILDINNSLSEYNKTMFNILKPYQDKDVNFNIFNSKESKKIYMKAKTNLYVNWIFTIMILMTFFSLSWFFLECKESIKRKKKTNAYLDKYRKRIK